MIQQTAASAEQKLDSVSSSWTTWQDAWRAMAQLPRRPAAAFLARCGRRVQPLCNLPPDHLFRTVHVAAIDTALHIVELYAQGQEQSPHVVACTLRGCQAASALLEGDLAGNPEPSYLALQLISQAVLSVAAERDQSVVWSETPLTSLLGSQPDGLLEAALVNDARELLRLHTDSAPDQGQSLDPRPTGPLGELWPDEVPEWYRRGWKRLQKVVPGAGIPPPYRLPIPESRTTPRSAESEERLLQDWRWVLQQREQGNLACYAGKHIAVSGQTVLLSDDDLYMLHQTLLKKHDVDPREIVVTFID